MIELSNKEFYIVNVSKMNVTLSDLSCTIPARQSVNLLSKHYHYTLEQLLESATNGSLFKKRDKIWLRNGELKKYIDEIKIDKQTIINKPIKSNNVIEQVTYDELNDFDSDDKYVDEILNES